MFSTETVAELKTVLSICKSVGIDAVVLADGKSMGTNEKRTLAIIADCSVVAQGTPAIGIGRIGELLKRIDLFDDTMKIEGKQGQKNEMVQLTLSTGRTKAQFRCTSTSMIPHPKSNEDPPHSVFSLNKAESTVLYKAIKNFSAETAVIKIDSKGMVRIECVDSTNDQFSTVLENSAEFVNEDSSLLFSYAAPNLAIALEAGAKETGEVELVVGEAGSITVNVRGRSIVIIPNFSEE